jgi:proline racemase
LQIDIVFGGSFFAIVHVDQLGLSIEPRHASRLVELGMAIRTAANQTFSVKHPIRTQIDTIALVEFSEPGQGGADFRNVVVFGSANLDRSPCGTGTCARMAEQFSRGKLEAGQVFIHESIIGTRFEGMVVGTKKVGEYDAVVPRVKASAYLTGFNTLMIDPADPLQEGFVAM